MNVEPIAVIGMGCRLPQAPDPDSFWELLREGRSGIVEVPAERWDADALYAPDRRTPRQNVHAVGGFLDDVDGFDPLFFKIMPIEAMRIDPQHRLVLEVAWEALEYAGVDPTRLAGTHTGVYVGVSHSDHDRLLYRDRTRIDGYNGPNTYHCFAANRLSYFLKLRGPSLAVDTACSSSLAAVHLACQSLRLGECDLALAGGVNLNLTPEEFIALSFLGVLSPGARCAPFAADADGYVRGEGCGILVLKRLDDALDAGDNILAVIRGSALNHNGLSNGITAPSGAAQEDVIHRALRHAGVAPAEVGHIETMGTGTALGDPIEIAALAAVYAQNRPPDRPCWVSSVKANIGHLEAASGAASLIKVILSLTRGEIPPQLHVDALNPQIRLEDSPLAFPRRCEPWNSADGGRRAAVSAFGFGGSNAHVILEAASEPAPPPSSPDRPLHLLTLSAKNESALQALAQRYRDLLARAALPIGDVCHTSNIGRAHWPQRLAVIAGTRGELIERLAAFVGGTGSDGLALGRAGKRSRGETFPPADAGPHACPKPDDIPGWSELLASAAEQYVAGVPIDWATLDCRGDSRRRIPLPTYPFQRVPCRFVVEQ